MGFALPLRTWLASSPERVFGAPPQRSRLGDLVDPALLDRLLAAHRAGTADHTGRIYSLMLLDRWLDHWSA
jgi:hypothetical protein